MSALTFRQGVVAGFAAAGLIWTGSALAQQQSPSEEAQKRALEQLARAFTANARIFSGGDIGFQARGVEGETPVVVPVVKVNGAWVEVQLKLGEPGIRRLTK
jgi:hypothetical protein